MRKNVFLLPLVSLALSGCVNRGPHVNDPLGKNHYYVGRICCLISNDLIDSNYPITYSKTRDCGENPHNSKYHTFDFEVSYLGTGYVNCFKYSITGTETRFKLEVTKELDSVSLDVLESYYSFMSKYVRSPKYSSISEIIKDENDMLGPDSSIKQYSVYNKNNNLITYTEDPLKKVATLVYEDSFDHNKFELNSGADDICVNWHDDWMNAE
ncbi:MAG: hypothetical protein MJ238_05760 [Bacilli bacterium]|nr:hypothetical protein [Bacilli bacterium]